MSKRIAMVGAGALGGYVGGYLAHQGHDVTMIDMWPENIEAIRSRGIELDGVTPEEKFTVKNVRALHLTEVQSLAKAAVKRYSWRKRWAFSLKKSVASNLRCSLWLPAGTAMRWRKSKST